MFSSGIFAGDSLPLSVSGRNVLINGSCIVDRRNTGVSQIITAAAPKVYTIDRWYAYCTGANVTGQQVSGSGQTQFRYRFTGLSGNTGVQFGQRIEVANSYHLSGQVCTLSADLASSSATSVTWTAYYANTSDVFGTIASPTRTQIATGTFAITSSIARYSVQISIPTAATTGVEIVFSVASLPASQTWTIGNVQLEVGSVATPFEHMPVSLIRQMCLRYYQVISGFTKRFDSTLGSGTGVTHGWSVQYPVRMRLTPTAILSNQAGANFTSLSLTGTTAESTVVLLQWLTDGVVARSVATDIILEAEL